MPNQNGHCPYCESVGFYNEAIERPGLGWVNQCGRCNRFSVYNESDGKQYQIDDAQKPDGNIKK